MRQDDFSEDDLILGLRANSRKAYSVLYDKYAHSIYAVIFELVKDKGEAENILQETFVKIWRNIDKYDAAKGRLFTWMIVIARRSCLDVLKSVHHQQKKKIQSDEILVYTSLESKASNTNIDPGLIKSIGELDESHRLMIQYQYFMGMTQQEVSDETGIPLGTVKTRTRNALLQLRKKLENEYS